MYVVKITIEWSDNLEYEEPRYFTRIYSENDLGERFTDKLSFKKKSIELARKEAKWWFNQGWNRVHKIEDLGD